MTLLFVENPKIEFFMSGEVELIKLYLKVY